MFENLLFTSLTNTVTQAANRLWDSTKSFLTIEPEPLWQKAMREPGYQNYLRFKSDLKHSPERAMQNIVSPYAVIANTHPYQQSHEDIQQLLESNTETALTYFYNDIINHLVELSANQMNGELLMTNATIDTFKHMLAFYQPYVPEDIYQAVLKQTQLIDTTDIQSSLISFTKKINQAFKHLQIDVNPEIEEEKLLSQNPEPYHSVNYKHLILMGAVSLLANRNSLGLGLATALLAEPVGAAYPTVVNPIPTQYAQPGQAFSYDIDLNQVFNDADGDIMTFGATFEGFMNWAKIKPAKRWGRDYANEAQDVEIVGDIAYVANGQYGLLIFNVVNPVNKVFLGRYATSGIARAITVQNNVAYVAGDSFGLHLINVSNASNPTFLGRYDTPGTAYDVTVQNGVAYVADLNSGLQLIDVSNPNNLTLLGSVDTPGYAYGVTVQNGVAYVADAYSGLLINVSNFNNLTLLGSVDTLGTAFSITVQNGVAYVADRYSGLQLINVSNPNNLTLLGRVDTSEAALSVAVQNGIAYVADDLAGLQIINVSNPNNLTLLGRVDTLGTAFGVRVLNGVVYLADGASGLQLINVSDASNPTPFGSLDTFSGAYGVTVQNNVAYVADNLGLQLINVSDTTNPMILGRYSTFGAAQGVTVQNGVAYVADDYSGLQLINVSNPLAPSLLSYYDTPGFAHSVAVQNGIAYVADDTSGLQLIDVNNPSNPMLLGSYDTPGLARQCFLTSNSFTISVNSKSWTDRGHIHADHLIQNATTD